jgi:hypothetical protein
MCGLTFGVRDTGLGAYFSRGVSSAADSVKAKFGKNAGDKPEMTLEERNKLVEEIEVKHAKAQEKSQKNTKTRHGSDPTE